jgi:hypothetical protein
MLKYSFEKCSRATPAMLDSSAVRGVPGSKPKKHPKAVRSWRDFGASVFAFEQKGQLSRPLTLSGLFT